MIAHERDYVNITEAAALLGVSRVTIWRWIRDGRISASRLGHRTARISRRDLAQLLEASRPASTDAFGAQAKTATALRVRDELLAIAAREPPAPISDLSAQAQLLIRQLAVEEGLKLEQVVQSLQAVAGHAETLVRLIDQMLGVAPADLVPSTERRAAGPGESDASLDRQPGVLPFPRSPGFTKIALASPRLRQVLSGLLDNANRYGSAGDPINVVVSVAAPDVVELSVPDRGLGLPPGQRIQQFERFYRDHGESRKHGLDLGQFISRQIVDLHGGEIRAEFPPGGDARFVVRLPIGTARQSAFSRAVLKGAE